MNYVYRYVLNDEWIYVGKASAEKVRYELQNRIRSHSKDERFKNYLNSKVEYCIFEHKSDMNITETMLIKIHRPVLNVISKTNETIPFTYDESKIKWFDIKEFSKHRKSLEEEIQLEKIKELIETKSIIAKKKCLWFDNEYYLPEDPKIKKFAKYIYNCADKYFLNNKEEFYPECTYSFSLSFRELMFELDYQTCMTESSFSRKVKEAIKEVFPDNNQYSIRLEHKNNVFTFHVAHFSAVWRDVANKLLKIGDKSK